MTKKRSTQKAKLIRELSENHLVTRACNKIGIARSTYYNWLEDDPIFRSDVKKAQSKGLEKFGEFAESKLIENIKDGNQSAISYYLRFNHPRYRPQTLKLVIEENSQRQLEVAKLQQMLDELVRLNGVDAIIDAAVADPESFKKNLREGLRESYKRTDEI